MTLDDVAGPSVGGYHRDAHDTEVAAARSVENITGQQRMAVLALLRMYPGGLTDDEGGQLMGSGADRLTFGRRRSELYQRGLVVKTDTRRPTPRGRYAIVWALAEERS